MFLKRCLLIFLLWPACLIAQDLQFEVDGEYAILNGVISSRSPSDFRAFMRKHPNIRVLIFEDVPGSQDDEANLRLARMVRKQGLATVAPRGAFVASGGVDLFLAGRSRQVQCGAELGVHSWAMSDGTEGKDVPRNSRAHRPYLSYYRQMGIPESFYWYTLEAAAARDIHIMSNREIAQFGIATVKRAC